MCGVHPQAPAGVLLALPRGCPVSRVACAQVNHGLMWTGPPSSWCLQVIPEFGHCLCLLGLGARWCGEVSLLELGCRFLLP